MNKRYSTKPRQIGSLGFQWILTPVEEIMFTELKEYVESFKIDLKNLQGLMNDPKDKDDNFCTVKINYAYPIPHNYDEHTIREAQKSAGVDPESRTLFAQEEIYGPQDKVYEHIISNYYTAGKMFIHSWNKAKHDKLRTIEKLKSPFLVASTAQRLTEEFYKSRSHPAKFAEKLNKDKSNIYKEVKGDRKISVDQAINYSEEFGCDPVSLLFEDLTTECWGSVDLLHNTQLEEMYTAGRIRSRRGVNSYLKKEWSSKKSKTFLSDLVDKKTGKAIEIKNSLPIVKVPRDIYSPDIKAIKIESKGSYLNNYLAYYYYSKNQNKSAHGKLAIVGQEWINEEFGIQETYYWFGIYEEQIGGSSNILNPDPLAKNKYIAKNLDNIVFIAPVVSLVHPSTLAEDDSKREALRFTDQMFEREKELNDIAQKIEEFKLAADKMSKAALEREKELLNRLQEEAKEKEGSILSWLGKKSA